MASDEQLKAVVDAVAAHPSKRQAATALGINESTLRKRLKIAARRGLAGFKPVLEGFEIKQTSTQLDADGKTEREWVQQRPEHGPEYKPPEGHIVKGYSTLVDGDGRAIQQWIKTREADNSLRLVDAIKSAFDGYKGFVIPAPPPDNINADLLTVYNIADHHLGLFAWGRETGADYDLKIGEAVLMDAMSALVQSAPQSDTAIVLNLGDFVHADSNANRTEKSGHALDVDTRYGKVLQVGVRLMIACIDMALHKHAKVIVRYLPGNHDPHTALALSVSLAAFYHAHPRVKVDCDPSKFFWHVFGRVFIGATHGDMVTPIRMPGVMAATQPEAWGATRYRYAYFGHVHHKSIGGGEQDGVVWETFQTLSTRDAWHAASGYSSGRSMVAITHHRQRGEVMRHTVSAKLEAA